MIMRLLQVTSAARPTNKIFDLTMMIFFGNEGESRATPPIKSDGSLALQAHSMDHYYKFNM